MEPNLKTVLLLAAAWVALGGLTLLIASAGGRRQLEESGFFRPYHGLRDLMATVAAQTVIVVAGGPALILSTDFRVAIGQTLIRFGRWLQRLAER